MSIFSRRYGYNPEKNIQIKSMDKELKIGLWNALCQHFWNHLEEDGIGNVIPKDALRTAIRNLWLNHYKEPLSSMPYYWDGLYEEVTKRFGHSKWYEVFDLLEALYPFADNLKNGEANAFASECNRVFEMERSAYRFVGGHIVPVTNQSEIGEIEEAMVSPSDAVADQIRSALSKLSDKKNPDYRNCIKESIGAVETAARLAAGDPKGTLGSLLRDLKKKLNLHPAQVEGFQKLYGFTSDDKSGIRHAMMDKDDLTSDDARFMLVTCSAFANYLLRLAERAGLKFKRRSK